MKQGTTMPHKQLLDYKGQLLLNEWLGTKELQSKDTKCARNDSDLSSRTEHIFTDGSEVSMHSSRSGKTRTYTFTEPQEVL